MIKFKPDFVTPANTTFNDGFGGAAGSFVNIALGTTTRACNGAAGPCISQPGTTTKLDTLADRLMYRLPYRNRGASIARSRRHRVIPMAPAAAAQPAAGTGSGR